VDPDGWFSIVDINRDGLLSRDEVREVLRAQVDVDPVLIDEILPALFRQADSDQDGLITREELMRPESGLLAYVRDNMPRRPVAPPPPPDLSRDKAGWFRFFDADGTGTLSKDEVLRALTQTLGLCEEAGKVAELRSTLDNIWTVFDTDGSGAVDGAEFIARDGLADTLAATLGARR